MKIFWSRVQGISKHCRNNSGDSLVSFSSKLNVMYFLPLLTISSINFFYNLAAKARSSQPPPPDTFFQLSILTFSARWSSINPLAHSTTPVMSCLTSSFVFPAWRHTRTRSAPFGTVGHVIGRTIRPRLERKEARRRAWGVRRGIIGGVCIGTGRDREAVAVFGEPACGKVGARDSA